VQETPGASRRSSRKQRITLVALFYLQKSSPDEGVWSHDLHRWLKASDPKTAIPQPTLLVILNRAEEQGLTMELWEQFDRVVRRPPRKYHALTEHGVKWAIEALQELRADKRRPAWVPIFEIDGRTEPDGLDEFDFTRPDGTLVEDDDAPQLRAVR
jgi:DNA-binding PadR family transcriptional regulator